MARHKIPRKYDELTKEQETEITAYFFGPFKPEWFDKNNILDNRDGTIAKALGVALSQVSHFTITMLEVHMKKVNDKHDKTRKKLC